MNVPHCLLFEPFDSSTSCMSLIPSRDVLAHGHCLSVVSSGKIDKNCNCLCVTEKKKKQTLHAHYCVYISTIPNYYQTMVGLSLRYLESMFILWFKKKNQWPFAARYTQRSIIYLWKNSHWSLTLGRVKCVKLYSRYLFNKKMKIK